MDASARREFWEGCRDCLPLMIGGVPFGLTCGMLSVAAGFNLPEVALTSLVVFSGASQFVTITMLQSGYAQLSMVILNVLLVNVHNLLLMTSLAPYLIKLPQSLRHALCFGISDGTYAITMNRIAQAGYSAYYQLGASAVQYGFWFASNIAGALIGARLPHMLAWGLDFALPAVFIAILVPKIRDNTTLGVCIAAAVTAVLAATFLGGKWYILLAAVVGAITGGWLEGRHSA